MVTSFSVDKDSVEAVQYLKAHCKKYGLSKSHIVCQLIREWKDRECSTSTRSS